MTKYSKQETFDLGVERLLRQGRRSVSKNGGGCVYENERGDRCIGGLLLTDGQIDELHEKGIIGEGADSIVRQLKWPNWNGHNTEFVYELQWIHDLSSYLPDHRKEVGESVWPLDLWLLGKAHNLDTSIISKTLDSIEHEQQQKLGGELLEEASITTETPALV